MKRMKCCIRMGMRVVGLGFSSKTLLTSAKQKQNFAIVSKKRQNVANVSETKTKFCYFLPKRQNLLPSAKTEIKFRYRQHKKKKFCLD